MSLLTPDLGLLFWMLVAFGTVFFVLAKFGFPVIVKMVDERKAFIDNSLESAKAANERLENIKEEADKILSDASAQQLRLLGEAKQKREQMLSDAKTQAAAEAAKLLQKATADIQKAKIEALGEIRAEVAVLSVGIAEKVLRQQLIDRAQQTDMINRLLDEVEIHQS